MRTSTELPYHVHPALNTLLIQGTSLWLCRDGFITAYDKKIMNLLLQVPALKMKPW